MNACFQSTLSMIQSSQAGPNAQRLYLQRRPLVAVKLGRLALCGKHPVFAPWERKLFHRLLVHFDTVADLFAERDAVRREVSR